MRGRTVVNLKLYGLAPHIQVTLPREIDPSRGLKFEISFPFTVNDSAARYPVCELLHPREPRSILKEDMDEWTVTLSRLWQSFLALIGLACKVRLTHAANSARIGREGKSETLVDLLYSQCPSLYGAGAIYRPTLYLAGGHISTIFSSLANFNGIDDVVYDRQYLRTVDGGTLALDIAPRLSECAVDDRPCLLMIRACAFNIFGNSQVPHP